MRSWWGRGLDGGGHCRIKLGCRLAFPPSYRERRGVGGVDWLLSFTKTSPPLTTMATKGAMEEEEGSDMMEKGMLTCAS